MSAPTFTKTGNKATTPAKLNKDVFGVEVKSDELLRLAYNLHLANQRDNIAKTKRRGEVSGGGKKPWKQKGTGRARFGSSRVPIWRGGGIVFGPKGNENYTLDMPVKAKRTAIRQALSLANSEGRLKVIESIATDGKVQPTVKMLAKIDAKGATLVVLGTKDEKSEQATRNIANVKAVSANYLNVFDLVNADTVVVDTKAVEVIHQWLGKTKESK